MATGFNWDEIKNREPEFLDRMDTIFKLSDWALCDDEDKPSFGLTKEDIFKTTFITPHSIVFESLCFRREFESWEDYSEFIYNRYGLRV